MEDDEDFNSVAWDTGVHPNPFQDVHSPHSTIASPSDDTAASAAAHLAAATSPDAKSGSLTDLASTAHPSTPHHNRSDAHRESDAYGPGASSSAGAAATDSRSPDDGSKRTSFTAFGVPQDNAMTIRVSDPQKQEEKEPYVTYLVSTRTTLENYAHSDFEVRRRFQDFVWLKGALKVDFPACIVPPVPEKHGVVGYIVSDRFSPDFLEKRRSSLERYLNRIARHPTLRTSPSLRTFLEARDFNASAAEKQKNSGTVFDNLGDTLLNAFAKIKKKDDKFVEMKETADKLEENLGSIEKLYQRVIKRQGELEQEYIDFSNAIMTLGSMETGMTDALNAFAQTLDKYIHLMKDMSQKEQDEFVTNVREYLAYCHNAKSVLKLRDQKQLDFEELSDYLQAQIAEQERCLNPYRGSSGLLSSIRDKYDEIKGVDQEQAKHDKLERLKFRIAELQEAVESSNSVSAAFSNEVSKEFDRFEVAKVVDLKVALKEYTAGQVDFYKKGAELWESIIPVLERMPVDN